MTERRLIINGDDYGLCREVNAAIETLAEAGMLGGVSLLANGGCLEPAVRFLRRNPQLAPGVHLNTVELRPLSSSAEVRCLLDQGGRFLSLGRLLLRWTLHPRDVSRAVETEWRAQIEYLLEKGIALRHMDTHQHLHAFPPAFACAVRLCREYGIPALRIPIERFGHGQRFPALLALRSSLALARLRTSAKGVRGNDHFLGFRRAGRYDADSLAADIASLPTGLTELAIHPSSRDEIPYRGYQGSRELRALLDRAFERGLQALNVRRVSWADA